MKKVNPLDEKIFPPFEGFPKEGIDFLRRLKKNNTREWFAKNKIIYEDFVKLPMQCLVASLKTPMMKLAPRIEINPTRNIFRIYRDTRFGKIKIPYKTNIAAVFHLRGHWQESAGFYVHIEPNNIYVGGGIYMPDSDQLKLIRRAIADNTEEFCSIVESKVFIKRFGLLQGEKLQRAPLGYQPNHPMIEWLKYKSFYTGVDWKEKECYTPMFLDKVIKVYKDLLPMIRFLNVALKKP